MTSGHVQFLISSLVVIIALNSLIPVAPTLIEKTTGLDTSSLQGTDALDFSSFSDAFTSLKNILEIYINSNPQNLALSSLMIIYSVVGLMYVVDKVTIG